MRLIYRSGRNVIAFTLALCLSACAADAVAKDSAPNIVIMLCDDLGYGDLGCYGHPSIQTPHLDELAQQGMRLTDFYATAPVCSSSRAGLLTGRTPSRLGVYDWIPAGHVMHLRPSEQTIASLLRDAGYATCHVGKWHLNGKFNSPEQPQPGDHGFDHWFGTQNNASPTHHNPGNFVRNGKPVGALEGYSCQVVADEAIDWLEDHRDPAKPFFLFACFHEPHEPIASPPELVSQYPKATKRGEALYYANVTNMDRAVGRMMKALDELKLADNTLVVFTSDNGPETLKRYQGAWRSHGSPGPLRGMKLHVYDGGIRVPGIVRFPGRVDPGQEVTEPVGAIDLLSTCCELAGVETSGDRALDGTSLMPLLAGDPIERQTPLYWHYYLAIGNPKAAMRVGNYMILGHWDGSLNPGGVNAANCKVIKEAKLTEFELYNVRKDVAQEHNLAEEEPERLESLAAKLVKKYREVQAEGPVWE